jgi:predicted alpha/beta-fold hydrolase
MEGHLWTAYVHLRDRVRPPRLPAREWSTTVADDRHGEIELTGYFSEVGPDLIVLVHGLGGRADSGYVVRTARVAEALGYSTLRLALRGADRRGQDFYHAGLTADLRAALASPEASRFRRRFVIGFSMGGHISLRLAAEGDHDVEAFATVCAPLDLGASCAHIDRRSSFPYRRHVLQGLKEMYREVARTRDWATLDDRDLRGIRTIREWDRHTIVPRFGFADPDDYYRSCSAGPLLGSIDTPTLYLTAEADPMVTADTVLRPLASRSSAVEVDWLTYGGHVAFPEKAGVDARVVRWLTRFVD